MAKGTKDVAVGFCLDETGSMTHIAAETINGFNNYVKSLRGQEGKTTLTLTQFSARIVGPKFRTRHDGVDIGKVAKLDAQSYVPDGNTPLYDAIGHTIAQLEAKVKGVKPAPSVIVAIQTDGYENSSTDYTREQIVKLIQKKERKGWLFVYLGADQNAVTAERAAVAMGMSVGSSMAYSGATTDAAFASAGQSINYVRTARAAGMHVNSADMANTAKTTYSHLTGTDADADPVGKVWDPKVGGWIDDPDA